MVRAKFQLQESVEYAYGEGRRLMFRAQYDQGVAEDQRFSKATPTGEFWMHVDNPLALAQFKLGEYYYFDAHPARAVDASLNDTD